MSYIPGDIKRYWILVTGDSISVPENMTHLSYVLCYPDLFGVNYAKEIEPLLREAARERNEKHAWDAIMDRVLSIGCGGLENTDKQDSKKDMPAILLEITKRNPLEVDKHGLLFCMFWRESYPFYERIMRWLSGNQETYRDMTILMCEHFSSRKWTQTVDATTRGLQFSKDPGRGVCCVKCGNNVSYDEIIERRRCSRCGLWLA